MSTVDKKLLDQVIRLAKSSVVSAAATKGVSLSTSDGVRLDTPNPNLATLQSIIQRGIATLPLEQRVMLGAETKGRVLSVAGDQLIRVIGTWGVMSSDVVRAECAHYTDPHVFDKLVEDGLLECYTDSSLGSEQELVTLSEAGKQRFAELEGTWDEQAEELFSPLNEYEKMQLYLLLRKMMGSPAAELDSDVKTVSDNAGQEKATA